MEKIEIDETKTILLIAEVQKKNLLWDSHDNSFKTLKTKGAEWDKIAEYLRVPKRDLQTKWNKLVKDYKKELKKVNLQTGYKSKWHYFDSLDFLKVSEIAYDKPKKLNERLKDFIKEDIASSNVGALPHARALPLSVLPVKIDKKKEETKRAEINMSGQQQVIYQQVVKDYSEIDKNNSHFLRTFLPEMREFSSEDTLKFKSEMAQLVFKFAHRGKSWQETEPLHNHTTSKYEALPATHQAPQSSASNQLIYAQPSSTPYQNSQRPKENLRMHHQSMNYNSSQVNDFQQKRVSTDDLQNPMHKRVKTESPHTPVAVKTEPEPLSLLNVPVNVLETIVID